ncbi:hypothetical protein CR513_36346, partial [Mucuna pruriens]
MPERKPRSAGRNAQSNHSKTTKRVFTLSGTKASEFENLVPGIILGMDWLLANHVLINYLDKIVVFATLVVGKDERFITTNKAKVFSKKNAQTYMTLSSLKVENSVEVGDVPILSEFLVVFLEDVSSLPLEKETKFFIDLVLRTGPIFVALYRMSPLKLVDLRK